MGALGHVEPDARPPGPGAEPDERLLPVDDRPAGGDPRPAQLFRLGRPGGPAAAPSAAPAGGRADVLAARRLAVAQEVRAVRLRPADAVLFREAVVLHRRQRLPGVVVVAEARQHEVAGLERMLTAFLAELELPPVELRPVDQ